MYSSGLRISEVINLNLEDVDLKERVLVVRNGKGGKDRYVPFSKVSESFLRLYIENCRKEKKLIDEKALFTKKDIVLGVSKSANISEFSRIMEILSPET